jgi:DNA polymerase-3 subunit delta
VQCLGVPNRITIAVGSETVLVDRVKVNLTAAVTKEVPDITRIVVDSSHDEVSANIAQACAPTLFGEDVLVVIEGIDNLNDDGVDSLKAVMVDLPENVWLLLTHPGGVKRKPLIDAAVKAGGEKIDCKEIKRGPDTTAFLIKEVTRRKRKMTPDALDLLVESFGQDLSALTNAIGQLSSDVEVDPIDAIHVRAYFEGTAPISGYAISDALWDKKTAEAIKLLRQSTLESDPGRVGVTTITALASGLRSMILVGGSAPGASENDVAREAGVPPWKVKTLRRQWSRWSGDQRKLAGLVVALADADPAMKGGIAIGSALDPEQKLFELEKLVTRTN